MTIDEVYNDVTFSDIMGIEDEEKICVPTMKEVIEFLRDKSSNMRLFASIPIGMAALVCLECSVDGWGLHASADGGDIDCATGAYEGWDEIYLSDTDAELRGTAHHMLSVIHDAIEDDRIFCRGIFA